MNNIQNGLVPFMKWYYWNCNDILKEISRKIVYPSHCIKLIIRKKLWWLQRN